MRRPLPRQALIAATGAALAGLGLAAGIIRVARWNAQLGRYQISPHRQ